MCIKINSLICSACILVPCFFSCFFFNDTATTEIYTLSLHDALPIFALGLLPHPGHQEDVVVDPERHEEDEREDRKSTRLNSSHLVHSYAVFCLKKKTAFETQIYHGNEQKRSRKEVIEHQQQ